MSVENKLLESLTLLEKVVENLGDLAGDYTSIAAQTTGATGFTLVGRLNDELLPQSQRLFSGVRAAAELLKTQSIAKARRDLRLA